MSTRNPRTVADLMSEEVVTLERNETLSIADNVMRLGRIRHMPVIDEGGALSFLGNSAPDDIRAESIGEFAGITRLSRSALRDYCSAAETLRREDEARGHYEELIYALVEAGKISVHVRHCPGLPWTEVDVPQDLERAKREVLPRIPPATVETPAA